MPAMRGWGRPFRHKEGDVMISLSNRTRRALLATTATCLILPVAAKAADDTDAKATDAGEIVVTARKVSERLQDVPISVTALSNEALWSRGAADVKDVLLTVPGLTYAGAQDGPIGRPLQLLRPSG